MVNGQGAILNMLYIFYINYNMIRKSLKNKPLVFVSFFLFLLLSSFDQNIFAQSSNINKAEEKVLEKKMLDFLQKMFLDMTISTNTFSAEGKLRNIDSLLPLTKDPTANLNLVFRKGNALLEAGREQEAVILFDRIATFVKDVPQSRKFAIPALGLAYMRLGERNNCINNHSADACIMPIQGGGIHKDKVPAEKAIQLFELALKENPTDPDSRWLLNIAYACR